MHWDNAIIFYQNWSSGTPGTKKQELVTGLNPGIEFTFAIKWKDSAGNWQTHQILQLVLLPFPKT